MNISKVERNSIVLGLRMVMIMCITLFTTRFVLRGLGVEDYGLYNVVMGIVNLCTVLNTALTNGMQRFYNVALGHKNPKEVKEVFVTGMWIHIALAAAFIVVAEIIGVPYIEQVMVVPEGRMNAVRWIFQFGLAGIAFIIIGTPYMAGVIAHEKMGWYAVVTVTEAVLKLGIAMAIVRCSTDRLIVYGGCLMGVRLLSSAMYAAYCKLKFGEEVKFEGRANRELTKKMLSFSGWNLFETSARMVKIQGLTMAINLGFKVVINAARGVVLQVEMAIAAIADSVVIAGRPQVIQLYAAGEKHKAIKLARRIAMLMAAVLIAMVVPLWIGAEWILKLWLADGFMKEAVVIMRVAIVTMAFDKLSSPMTMLVHASGKMMWYNIVSGVTNLGVLIAAIVGIVCGADYEGVYWIACGMTAAGVIALWIVERKVANHDRKE